MPIQYKLYRRRCVGAMLKRGDYVPPPAAPGSNQRRVEWPEGIKEFWVANDPAHLPGSGRGRSKKEARANLRKLLALETNPKPFSRRAERRLRRALEAPSG